ncbi:hypothetical protein Ais01nite_26980 [Asanoa ishikariensis]|nr:hypothetical protein Ais01nite_26980 [Asanoa ishikariensis]
MAGGTGSGGLTVADGAGGTAGTVDADGAGAFDDIEGAGIGSLSRELAEQPARATTITATSGPVNLRMTSKCVIGI